KFRLWNDANGNGKVDSGETEFGAEQTTGANGKASWSNVPFGDYVVTETKAPTGYTLPSNPVKSFTIDASNVEQGISFTVKDPQKTGSITVNKTDADTQQPLDGATFQLWDDVNGNGQLDT